MAQDMASLSSTTISFVFAFLLHATTGTCKSVPAIFVFGDSLADVGNNNYLSVPLLDKADFSHNGIDFPGQISTGRFSNGYNGVDYIAKFLGFKMSPPAYLSLKNDYQILQGASFASAGSGVLDTTGNGTINMKTQIEYFQDATKDISSKIGQNNTKDYLANSLFIIVTVNNDLFDYYYAATANSSTSYDHFLATLASKFESHIKSLYKLGARKFWISGTGQIGCVPYLTSSDPSGTCIQELNQMSHEFNEVAEPLMHRLSLQLPGLRYSYSDSHNMTSLVKARPRSFGFKDLNSACCGGGKLNGQLQCTPHATYCRNRNDYIFWDWFHPTQAMYKLTSYMAYYDTGFSRPVNIKQLVESNLLLSQIS